MSGTKHRSHPIVNVCSFGLCTPLLLVIDASMIATHRFFIKGYYGFAFKLPSDWKFDDDSMTLMQFIADFGGWREGDLKGKGWSPSTKVRIDITIKTRYNICSDERNISIGPCRSGLRGSSYSRGPVMVLCLMKTCNGSILRMSARYSRYHCLNAPTLSSRVSHNFVNEHVYLRINGIRSCLE